MSLRLLNSLHQAENVWVTLLGLVIPLVCSLGLLVGGFLLWQKGVDETAILRVALWCVAGGVLLAVGTGFVHLYLQARGLLVDTQLFIILNAISGGSLTGFVVGVYDIRRRRAEQRAARLNEWLTVLNRILRHDIRNQANIVYGHAELLEEATEHRDEIKRIQEHAMELVSLGDRARMLEQLSKENSRNLQTVDVAALVDKQLVELTSDYSNVDVETSFPDELRVSAHPLLEYALQNLLENAVIHNDKETPQLWVSASVPEDPGAEYVEIEIVDNGPGIPDSEVAVLEQGYETPLEHSGGLGLWLSKWIVAESSGRLSADTASPHGTRICIRLPLIDN
ncbi:sensor histidine kinase KdpD [Halobellus sp. Atlit-38R]|uniref:sensor histidine kinase n=1 Tax=Halobellus sp. Atlit-38R TaxID=2282131 RepID=UPI00131456E5|nr:HAMP domain-containing sensor histidine kinase [Halobellus sp. Atlit-38R]